MCHLASDCCCSATTNAFGVGPSFTIDTTRPFNLRSGRLSHAVTHGPTAAPRPTMISPLPRPYSTTFLSSPVTGLLAVSYGRGGLDGLREPHLPTPSCRI